MSLASNEPLMHSRYDGTQMIRMLPSSPQAFPWKTILISTIAIAAIATTAGALVLRHTGIGGINPNISFAAALTAVGLTAVGSVSCLIEIRTPQAVPSTRAAPAA